ncbi:FecR domain-containing protein [bacterium]|nr:FecR domain-containing protein [bacterium]
MDITERHRELIGRFLEGGLSDAETAELGCALAADPTLADALAQACRVDVCLAEHFSVQAQTLDMTSGASEPRAWRGPLVRWAAAAVLAIGALAGSLLLRRSYPDPQASGDVTVTDGTLRRGATVRTADDQQVALTLGGYCQVDVNANSVVRVVGAPRDERIILERGRVACDVTPGAGQFAVETEHCTISVKGTRFAVELLENQGGQAMLNKHVLVKVFAGAVLMAAAGAQEVVKEGEEKLVPGKIVVTAEGMAMSVGHRRTYAISTPDGKRVTNVDVAIIGKHTVGGNTLYRAAARFGTRRTGDFVLAVGADGYFHYDNFGMTLPGSKHPLPLEEGMAFEYESTEGKVSARVVGTEAVEVPAGKFACLKIERTREVDGEERTRTSWIAPGIGMVKEARGDSNLALVRFQPTVEPKPEKGTVVLSSFDTDEPLLSPILGRGRWGAHMGEPGRSSDIDIDPFTGGANGTPFCLRWTYTTLGTWVSTSIGPGGGRPADLSKYAGLSFYVKGLLGKPCTMTIVGKSPEGGDRPGLAHIRFQVTQKWQKIIITPDTHPELKKVDLRQVYSIGLSDYAKEGAAHNVIWLDEVKFHEDAQVLKEELQDRQKIMMLLDGKKGEF